MDNVLKEVNLKKKSKSSGPPSSHSQVIYANLPESITVNLNLFGKNTIFCQDVNLKPYIDNQNIVFPLSEKIFLRNCCPLPKFLNEMIFYI